MRIQNRQKGVTLVESLVAVAILGVALTPALTLTSSALRVAGSIQNNIIAANLAQEGIEVVRGIRDGNWFQARPFTFRLDNCPPPGGCRVSWNSDSAGPDRVPATHPVGTNPALYISPGTGLYHYEDVFPMAGSAPSPFSRRITIEPRSQAGVIVELVVVSEVTWRERERNRSIKVEGHLFDWK